MNRTEPYPLGSLEADLNTWRKTPFDRLLTRRNNPVATLTEVVQLARRSDQPVLLDDVRTFLIAVVAAADDAETAAGPSADRGLVSNPAVIREIFGLTAQSRDASVENRQQHAARASGKVGSWHTLRDKSKRVAFVDQLGNWVRAYLDRQHQPSGEVAPAERAESLISRDDDLAWLRATYSALQRQGGGLFQIWGIAGIGKTTLATQFASMIGPDEVTGMIHMGPRGKADADLRRVLRLEGHDDSAWSDGYCLAQFRTAVQRLRRVRLLIFDGVTSPDQIIDAIPNGVSVPVLITGRERLRFEGNAYAQNPPALRLKTFNIERSLQFLGSRLPQLEDPDIAEELSEAVGGHPESLAHIGHYLKQENAMSPAELLEELHRQPKQTLIDLTEELGVPTCAAVAIEELFKQLDRKSLACAILLCLAWSDEMGQLPRAFVIEHAAMLRGEQPSPLASRAALGQLERLGLVGQTKDYIGMSRMTCQVIRDLTVTDWEPVLVAYEKLLIPRPDTSQRDLLNVLRQEYEDTKLLQPLWAKVVRNSNTPPPTLFCVDLRTWALFTTRRDGQRRAVLYRYTPGGLDVLHPSHSRWERMTHKPNIDALMETMDIYHKVRSLNVWIRHDLKQRQVNEGRTARET